MLTLILHLFLGFNTPPKRYYWTPPTALHTQPIGKLPDGGLTCVS